MQNRQIIALIGQKGSGKNTIAQDLVGTEIAFAAPLKDLARTLFPNIDIEDRELKEQKVLFNAKELNNIVQNWTNQFFNELNYSPKNPIFMQENGFLQAMDIKGESVEISPRDIQKMVGAPEWLRNENSDLISQYTINKIKQIDGDVIITDVRMINELRALNQLDNVKVGLVVRFEKDDDFIENTVPYDGHWTETLSYQLTTLFIEEYNNNWGNFEQAQAYVQKYIDINVPDNQMILNIQLNQEKQQLKKENKFKL